MKFELTPAFFEELNQYLVSSQHELLDYVREQAHPELNNSDPYKKFIQLGETAKFEPIVYYILNRLCDDIELAILYRAFQNSSKDESSDEAVDLFDFFSQTELAHNFFELQANEQEYSQVINELTQAFHKDTIDLITHHFFRENHQKYSLKPCPELGDLNNVININGQIYNDPKTESFSNSELKKLDTDSFGHNGKVIEIIQKPELESSKQIKSKITESLELLKHTSPDLYDALFSCTQMIVPIHDEGIVSFSSAELPGYSSINFLGKDLFDTMDDLTHENGHHILNYIMKEHELIHEDDEQIFFSPWRRSLRPIRGIYHATFTFFFAFKTFIDLYKSQQYQSFSKKDQEKIAIRALEEYEMILFCRPQLDHAYKIGKVTDAGHELIQDIFKFIKKESESIDKIKDSYSKNKKSEELFLFLEENKNAYQMY